MHYYAVNPQVQLPHANYQLRELTIGEGLDRLVKLNPLA